MWHPRAECPSRRRAGAAVMDGACSDARATPPAASVSAARHFLHYKQSSFGRLNVIRTRQPRAGVSGGGDRCRRCGQDRDYQLTHDNRAAGPLIHDNKPRASRVTTVHLSAADDSSAHCVWLAPSLCLTRPPSYSHGRSHTRRPRQRRVVGGAEGRVCDGWPRPP